MRQGELLALHWSSVDLDAACLSVTGTAQLTARGRAIGPPKTASSRRRVQLSTLAVEALRRHRLAQTEQRLMLGSDWVDADLVFPNCLGKLLDPSDLTRAFRALLVTAGLPRVRFHDLRHTAATLMLGRDVHPKVVSEMLGHASIGITLDTYSHVTPAMQRDAVSAMETVLRGR